MVNLVGISKIKSMIAEIRGERVILDSDLAVLYQVSTKRLMEQVKRNINRFPLDFMFQLTEEEYVYLRSQIATSSWGGRRYLPYVFTRNGANMVSAILKSPVAVKRSIQIMRAFTVLEELMSRAKEQVTASPKIISQLSTHSRAIMHLFQRDKMNSRETAKTKKIISEMISLLQQMVFKDIQ